MAISRNNTYISFFSPLVMSSGNDGARKKKKIKKQPHVRGSSYQAIICSQFEQKTLPPLAVNATSAPFHQILAKRPCLC